MNEYSRLWVGDDEEEEDEAWYKLTDWSDRIYVGMMCLGMSLLCTILGWLSMREGRVGSFAVMSALSSVFTISGSFAISWDRTVDAISSKERRCASITFLSSLVLTLYIGLAGSDSSLLIATTCSIFFLSQAWYTLSYIPYGRDAFKSCFGSCWVMCMG
eukprot:TRINITY_DN10175_c1_g2_i1.p1 TRINITY_DN10175_c1_g2~~TRINITY_DN10175_c1_g2_i1.p1  ORF type:complete len:159 (+),score=11.54 TRINITY_DN10175_c1_g2_i1:158-634(+)